MNNNYTWHISQGYIYVSHLGNQIGKARDAKIALEIETNHIAEQTHEAHYLLSQQRQQIRNRRINKRRRV